MIIESVALMTTFDVLMVSLALLAVFKYFRYYKALNELRYVNAVGLVVLGVVILSSTYLIDFAAMHIFPIFWSFEKSDQIMNRLYMHWNWWIAAVGVSLIVIGVAYLSRTLVPHTKKILRELSEQKQELKQSLEEQKKLHKELRELKNLLEERNISKSVELERAIKQLEALKLEKDKLQETINNFSDKKKAASDNN